MKKSILGLMGVVTLLGTTLASCGSNNEVKFNDAESRNLRLASGIGLVSKQNTTSIKKAAAEGEMFSSGISLALPSLDILVENDFNVDAKLEGDAENKKFEYNGMNYSFKETISYINNDETKNDIVIFYNYVNDAKDKKFTENIEGVVKVNETAYVNFTSTALLENGHSKRELSLYLGKESTTSLIIREETIVKDKNLDHKFTYAFKLAGTEVISYSIALDRANTTMSLKLDAKIAVFTFDLTRKSENGKTTYTAVASEGVTGTSLTLNFERVVTDGNVNYNLTASLK